MDTTSQGLSVTVFFRVSTLDPADFTEVVMSDDGLHNDGAAGDGVYGVTLPAMGDQPQPEHLEEVQRLLALCKKHGVAAGIRTGGIEYTQKYLELGFNFVALGSDSGHMTKHAAKELAAARGTQEQKRESSGY